MQLQQLQQQLSLQQQQQQVLVQEQSVQQVQQTSPSNWINYSPLVSA